MTRPSAAPDASGSGASDRFGTGPDPTSAQPAAPGAPAAPRPGGTEAGRRGPTVPVSAGPAKHRAPTNEDDHFEQVLESLRRQIRDLDFAEGLVGAEEGRALREDVLAQLSDYVLPRVRRPDIPLLIAVAGSTGAGKSTLVNSLVGEQVTTTGVRRPTTNSPVLACNPADVDWFSEASFIPSLPRVRQQGLAMPGKDGMLVLAATEAMPPGVALLDTPDVDSAVAAHHEFAAKFLDAADLWVFVTTSGRYADARVWEFLQVARDRDTSLAVVLSRVPRKGRRQLLDHFGAMLEANGLGNAARFAIPETDQIEGERFTSNVADHIREYLADVAGEAEQRDRVSRRTFIGVIDSFRTRVPELVRQVEAQIETGRSLGAAVDDAYAGAAARIDTALGDGTLLRGSLLARWQEVAASGELAKSLRLRGRRARKGRAEQAERGQRVSALERAVRDALEALVVSAEERASEQIEQRWREVPGGAALADRALDQPGSGTLAKQLRQEITEWQREVAEMTAANGATKRSVARFVTFDHDIVALVMIIDLLGYERSNSGGGAHAADASGPSPQRLLKGLFGAQSLRSIGGSARENLRRRVLGLLSHERTPFDHALAAAGIPSEDSAVQLYQATYNLEIAR
ncbi:ABC transporter [Nocardiopsis terrae]|uniref:Energy-coupling factor transporter ATP-binding protein EcfA2 n=1 Tax=Nocardiopsis terrae TaxID=372655 RepID=A0ABR9HD76_9ACTN|nr:dynamin family protein [Nocardiopsis terrae]MBE1456988.1 energy-coupling factor transporter ATP-binding protein EcfA2 [Nocardiopsis terrae]GHC89986.1 ABC transporter [Nocardiopsis terrae]